MNYKNNLRKSSCLVLMPSFQLLKLMIDC